MSTPDIQKFSQALVKHEHQLQRWVECLPVALQFAMPLRLEPPSEEPELVQLLRERYTQAYELLRRPYLYLCLHAHLDPELLEISTQRANDCLQLAVYRLRTERPFYRHPGSWGSCRIRFNHALCLVAAAKAKSTCWESARYVELPPTWEGSVRMAIDRLRTWQEEGAGLPELSILLEWSLHN